MRKITQALIISFAVFIFAIIIIISILGINNTPSTNNQYSDSSNSENLAGLANTQNTNSVSLNENVQEVKLSVSGSTYILYPSILKKGVPVKLVADMNKMPGCSKSVVIKDFGVSKYVRSGDNIIEFTPDKTGTFKIACSMNMYIGSFTVTEDGLAPTGAEAQKVAQAQATITSTPKSTCGMGGSGGGCGCGGR